MKHHRPRSTTTTPPTFGGLGSRPVVLCEDIEPAHDARTANARTAVWMPPPAVPHLTSHQSGPRRRAMRAVAWSLVAAGTITIVGCGLVGSPSTQPTKPTPSASPPCSGTPASQAALGKTHYDDAPAAAEFTTTGDTLYVSASNFDFGGPFDIGRRATGVFVGPAAKPPTKDPATTVTNITTELRYVRENEYVRLELPAGRYWLLTNNFADINLFSCTSGGVTGRPAPGRSPTGSPAPATS